MPFFCLEHHVSKSYFMLFHHFYDVQRIHAAFNRTITLHFISNIVLKESLSEAQVKPGNMLRFL